MVQIGLEGGLFMNILVSRKKLLGNTGDFLWSYGGYLIVSALCDLCGVTLDESNARNFITDCIESLHDTLKDNLNINGVNYVLSLNDDLISKFIEFYTTHNNYEYYFLKTPPLANSTLLYTFNLLERTYFNNVKDGVVGGQIGYFEPGKVTVVSKSDLDGGGYGWYKLIITGSNFSSNENLTHSSYSDLDSNFELRVPYNSVSDMVLNDKTNGKITLYPEAQGYKTLEEYKAKYENEPSRIILDSSIVNIKTKWKKEDTDIYIPNGNVENLPNGVKILYGLWVYNTGDQFTEITGGWENYHNDTNWFWSGSCYKGDIKENYLSFSIKQDKSMCSLATSNKINFEEVNKIKITYSRIANTNAYVALQIVGSLETSELSGAKLQVGDGSFATTENLDIYNTIEISYPEPKALNEKLYVLVVLWGEVAEYKETFRIKSIYIR